MILCSGCFDGLHAGHVAYLQAAAQQLWPSRPSELKAERLTVAVAPDAYIRQVKEREPRWSVVDRVAVLQALDLVDQVLVHGESGVEDVIRELQPRLFVKAEDWRDRLTPAVLDACREAHTSILFVPEYPAAHTSQACA
jgi:bifunctional ADP-heptose synthase (sugar kinase/adenylyltransferase)